MLLARWPLLYFFICCITKMPSSTTSLSYSDFWEYNTAATWKLLMVNIFFPLSYNLENTSCPYLIVFPKMCFFSIQCCQPTNSTMPCCIRDTSWRMDASPQQLFSIVKKKKKTIGSKKDQFSQLDPKASTIESHVGLLLFSVHLNRYSIQCYCFQW
jgi:hypothetical protein